VQQGKFTFLVAKRKEGTRMTFDPRHQSRLSWTAPTARARSYFKAIGFTDEDLKKPLVGVAHCWIEITPCNWNHRKMAEKVKEGIRAAGGTPIEFKHDQRHRRYRHGHEGMKASLISREVVAGLRRAGGPRHLLDGFVGISGCRQDIRRWSWRWRG